MELPAGGVQRLGGGHSMPFTCSPHGEERARSVVLGVPAATGHASLSLDRHVGQRWW